MQAWLRALYVLCLTRLLFPPISQARNKHMDKKWDAMQRPMLTKRALELTQKQMLNVLGLRDIPRPDHRRPLRPHVFMLDLYKTLSRKPLGKKSTAQDMVNTVRGVVDQERSDRSLLPLEHQLYVFDFSAIPTNEKLVSAELRVLRRPSGVEKTYAAEHGTSFRAMLYMKSNRHKTFYGGSGLELLDSFSFDIADTQKSWYVLTVTRAVEKWQKLSKKIHFLFLKVVSLTSGQLVNPTELGFSKDKRAHNDRALLVLFSNDGRIKPVEADNAESVSSNKGLQENNSVEDAFEEFDDVNSRAKRSASSNPAIPRAVANALNKRKKKKSRRGRGRRKACRLKPMYVDFQQLHWSSWIIAPSGYDARLCEGECTFPIDNHLRPTNHATVQTILHKIDSSLVPKPACCVPNKLSPISMLYIEGGDNVVYKKYENMVVDRCGCS